MAYPDRHSPLARYLLVVYALLIVYATLTPFSGWRDPEISLFSFLGAPLPRFTPVFDVVANVVAYIPLGVLVVLALHPRWQGGIAMLLAVVATSLASLSLETIQQFLPSRYPSNLDFAANTLGGILGAAAGSYFCKELLRHAGMQALRYRLFRDGARIDLGLVLLGLWLVTLLYPGTSLFGNGDLRAVLSEPGGTLHPAELFIRFEALVVGSNTVAVGLLLALLVDQGQPVRTLFIALLGAALVVRTLAYGILFGAQNLFDWLTPGASLGLAGGVIAVLVATMFSRVTLVMLCGMALMAATALVNFAPENPYFLAVMSNWQRLHFLNFNGFTRVLSAAWPFVAIMYVLGFAGSRERQREDEPD